MSILGGTDIANGMLTVNVDHDPTGVATDAPKGSIIINGSGDHYLKMDDGDTTDVRKFVVLNVSDDLVIAGVGDFGSLKIGDVERFDSSGNLTNISDITISKSNAIQTFTASGTIKTENSFTINIDTGDGVGRIFVITQGSSGITIFTVEDTGKVITTSEIEINGDLNHDGSNIGLYTATPVSQATHIIDADGTLADITSKFNTLLVALDADAGVGLLAGV